jgi:hypothetical protein
MTTLEDVLIDLVMRNADRCALVRSAQTGKCAAVCVLLLSADSIREIGGPLVKIAQSLGNGPEDFGAPIGWVEIGLAKLFETADTAPNGWFWASFKYQRVKVMLAAFVREVDTVAKLCTDNGAPCSLDPKAPAVGW